MARKKSERLASDVDRLLEPDVFRQLTVDNPGFDRRAFLSSFFDCCGGIESFARLIYTDYQAAAVGSMARQRLGGMVCTLMSQESQQDRQKPVEAMSDDELRESILAMSAKLTPGVPGPEASDG